MLDIEKQQFLEILKKYNQGIASEEEVKFLNAYYNAFEFCPDFLTSKTKAQQEKLETEIKDVVDQRLDQYQKDFRRKKIRKLIIRYSAAAILVLSVGAYYFINKNVNVFQLSASKTDTIAPGGNKAILFLANGTSIDLDNIANGEIVKQAGINITKTKDGQIVYTINNLDPSHKDQLSQNTIITPKGGQYQIILPDGSGVWLNAASKLKYPTQFSSTDRTVELEGEAYFEITKNKNKPFMVKTTLQTVEVLGTHFNVSAYKNDETTNTTLLEGSVKVLTSKASTVIKPGDQTIINQMTGVTTMKHNVDLEKEIAWKNGVFSFNNEDLRAIMRQVERWYDVQVDFQGDLPSEKYTGEISKSSNVTEILKILELNHVHFLIQGKKITVISNSSIHSKK